MNFCDDLIWTTSTKNIKLVNLAYACIMVVNELNDVIEVLEFNYKIQINFSIIDYWSSETN